MNPKRKSKRLPDFPIKFDKGEILDQQKDFLFYVIDELQSRGWSYKEIGIMKAVGASDADVKGIFFFESGAIGFLGGVFGLALGWVVSIVINHVVNYYQAKESIPYIDYFSFPWWLCLGAVAFSILVSLAAGIYPAIRAARVDPIVALRHD